MQSQRLYEAAERVISEERAARVAQTRTNAAHAWYSESAARLGALGE